MEKREGREEKIEGREEEGEGREEGKEEEEGEVLDRVQTNSSHQD